MMTKKTLVPHYEKIAHHHRMGAYRAHYGSERSFPVTGMIAIGVGVLLGGAFCLFAPLLLNVLSFWQVSIVPLIAVSWGVAGVWLVFSSLKGRVKMVVVCEQGILCRSGKEWEPLLWHEIDVIWYRASTTTDTSQYEIERTDGYSFVVDSTLPHAEHLKQLLEREVVHRLFAHCLDQYRRGISLSFGPVSISQQGMCAQPQKHFLPWCQLKYIDAFHGVVYIRQKQQHDTIASFNLSSIPNPFLLECLIRHIHRAHREANMQRLMLLPKRPLSVSQEAVIW